MNVEQLIELLQTADPQATVMGRDEIWGWAPVDWIEHGDEEVLIG